MPVSRGRSPATDVRVISGGQTGVDRGALDAALDAGLSVGGWCPWGRLADDGRIAERYPPSELRRADSLSRVRRNVMDADGTLVIYFGDPVVDTRDTLSLCLELSSPLLLVDASEMPPIRAARRLVHFIDTHRIRILNVAGPRASREPRGYSYARDVIAGCFQPAQEAVG